MKSLPLKAMFMKETSIKRVSPLYTKTTENSVYLF